MAIGLYEISVASYLQIVDAVKGILARGQAHFAETGLDAAEIVETP